MIFSNVLNEQLSSTEDNNMSILMNILESNSNMYVESCLLNFEYISEVHIDDNIRNYQEPKKNLFTKIKDLVIKIKESFIKFAKTIKAKIVEKINNIKARFNKNKHESNSNTKSSTKKFKRLELNDKFDKLDEKKLMNSEILDLSKEIKNYRKDLYENYDNAAYIKEVTLNVTNGLYESIDDLNANDLVSEIETTTDSTNDLNNLLKTYEEMISKVDLYFNQLQDSVRKATTEYEKNTTTSYSDDKVSANIDNPFEYMRMRKMLPVVAKMIGAQSGVVRNIVYAKVNAINKVLESRSK